MTESPRGSNSDHRKDGIRKAQIDCARGGTWLVGQPWCGTWVFNAMQAAGVKGISARQASVALIEEDARKRRAPFGRGWTTHVGEVLRGDLVIYFGRGVHVGMVRRIFQKNGRWWVLADEGNTSSGTGGSQDNGGGSYLRVRPLSNVHGFALINYPDH